MKTYVINLEKDKARKVYMQKILQKQHIENVFFVNAVYGKNLTSEEKDRQFDSNKFLRKYAKKPNAAQIGCTLSHRKCLEEFSKSGEQCCLILEDDIEPKGEMLPVINEIQKFLEVQAKPTIVLLSGWFWYTKKNNLENVVLGRLFSGFLAHSYMLNVPGCKLLLSEKPYFVADDWYEFRKKLGIKIYGLIPHNVNQRWNGDFLSSTQSHEIKYEKGFVITKLSLRFRGLIQKILSVLGMFEKEK